VKQRIPIRPLLAILTGVALAAAIPMVPAIGQQSPPQSPPSPLSGTVLYLSLFPSTHELDPVTGEVGPPIANGQDAVPSPDRTRVAYVRNVDPCDPEPLGGCPPSRELLTADPTGADERVVDQGDLHRTRLAPDWSPDGSRILFGWSDPDARGISWVRPDGSDLETLVLFRVNRGTFSPDGKHIAFVRDGNIYTLHLASRHIRAVTTDGGAAVTTPDWSPDGDRIVYAHNDGVNDGLFVVDVRTRQSTNLLHNPPNPNLFQSVQTPVFSPDGEHIAFAGSRLDSEAHIFVIDTSGGEPRPIGNTGGELTDWQRR
jgi:TolB protein